MEEANVQTVAQAEPVNPEPKKRKFTLLTIFGVIFGALLLLCCCCGTTIFLINKNTQNNFERELQKYYPDGLNSFYPTPTGPSPVPTLSFGKDVKLPEGYPSDVPQMSGSVLVASSYDEDIKQYTSNYEFAGENVKVMDFFKSELPKNGWVLDESNTIFGSFISATKNDRELYIYVFSIGSSVNYSITVTK